MTNRGTARRTKIHTPKKDDDGKDIPEEVTQPVLDAKAIHRAAHPNDLISFGEEPISKGPRENLSPKPFLGKHKSKMYEYITVSNKEALLKSSRKELLLVAHERLDVLRKAAEIDAPHLPIDEHGEAINYPNAYGTGKEAIVNWLIKYEDRYQEMNERLILDEDIKQSLLEAHR